MLGAVLLFWLLVESIIDMSDPESSSLSGVARFGVGPPRVIGVFVFVVGVIFMIFRRIHDGRFWREKPGGGRSGARRRRNAPTGARPG